MTRRRLDKRLAQVPSLLAKSFDLRAHEFHLNSQYILDILGVAQLTNKFLGGGNVLLCARFYFSPNSVPPDGADATVFFK